MTSPTAPPRRPAGRRNPWLWAAGLAAVLAAPVQAATPRDELLRFVPDDSGFCLVLQDLRGHAADLLDSPFADQVRRSPLGDAWSASGEVQQFAKADKELRAALGVGFAELRDDVLGDAVAFAYRPGTPGKPEEDQALLLIRAHSAEVLAHLIDNLNKAQTKDGSLTEVQEVTYHGAVYYRRVEKKQTNYYYVRGPVLLFTSQEEMLKRALDRDRTAAPEAEPPLTRKLRELGAGKAALAVWLNPRAFDAALDEKAARAAEPDASLLKHFRVYWKAIDAVAVYADLDKDFRLSWAEQFRVEDLPPAARRMLAAQRRPSDLWRAFPDDPLFAVAGRVDFAATFEAMGEFQPKDADGKPAGDPFAQDFLQKVLLPHLGPDWGVCVSAPAPGDADWLPRGVLALRVAHSDDAPADEALLSAVHTGVLLAVLANNARNPAALIRVQAVAADKYEIHFLVGDRVFPPGLQPAYALKDGWLLFATSPEVVRRFAVAPAGTPAPEGGPIPVLRVSFKAWRSYLTERREQLVAALAERNGVSKEAARQGLDEVIGGLEFLDRLELSQTSKPGQTVVTLTLQTAQPLKK
jgi:hypothetical protein